jgi:hypothetical protein
LESASASIDAKIRELGDWRGKTLAKVRAIVPEADPAIVEEWKWRHKYLEMFWRFPPDGWIIRL